jgi:hypothetical protein
VAASFQLAHSFPCHVYDVSGGNVSATYNNLALSQNYVEPTQFGQQVTFNPHNTNVSYRTGTFSTTSPQAGAGLALDAGINGSISSEVANLFGMLSQAGDIG